MTNPDTAARERGIIMSGESVRATLDGRKSVTRRVVKWKPREPGLNVHFSGLTLGYYNTLDPESGYVLRSRDGRGLWNDRTYPIRYRYGRPGDRLYVREAHTFIWPDTYPVTQRECSIEYRADGDPERLPGEWPEEFRRDAERPRWRPSIHMPKWAARIWLVVEDVRVERLQEITKEDAIAEGLVAQEGDGDGYRWTGTGYQGAREGFFHVPALNGRCRCKVGGPSPALCAFRDRWDALNGGRGFSFASNPWVWRIEYRADKERST